MMNVSGRTLDKSTGDVASDGYHKYKVSNFYLNLWKKKEKKIEFFI